MAFWEVAAREWPAGSQLQQEVPERELQSQLMKVKLQQAAREARVGMGASSWVRLRNARALPSSWARLRKAARVNARALPGHLLMKMKLQQVAREGEAREGEAVAREVARESGSCAFPACPSQSLSATGRAKTDRQSQWRAGDCHGRSARFAPRAGRPW